MPFLAAFRGTGEARPVIGSATARYNYLAALSALRYQTGQ
jgi:hypothetical protein